MWTNVHLNKQTKILVRTEEHVDNHDVECQQMFYNSNTDEANPVCVLLIPNYSTFVILLEFNVIFERFFFSISNKS